MRAAATSLVAIAILVLGACSGAAASATPVSAGAASGPDPTPVTTSAPASDLPAESPVRGGGSTDDPGTGVGAPADPTPIDPGAGPPALLVPKPGQLNPHPVAPTALQASVDGRHVLVKVSWYGGIEPCSVLDSVQVERSGNTIVLTVIEGSSDLNGVCAEIAMLKATIVDLGELEPGAWTITAPNGDVAPVSLTIS
ncbi:MAG TPA: hypothetical protein VH440_09415 [Candidatus Limnocylindrales bacterium]